MKLYKWVYGAMALSLLGACTDRDLIVNDGKETIGDYQETANGYLAVEIRLPQETSTRAEGDAETTPEDTGAMNDQYGDGTPQEYKVNNAMIILFKGESEKEATFYRVQNLEKPFFSNLPVDDPVSASYIASIPVMKNPEDDDDFFALVVLNRNKESTKIVQSEDGKTSTLFLATQQITTDMTFAEVLELTTEYSFLGEDSSKKSFFMINAPMSSKPAGQEIEDGDITYLTNLGHTVYETPEKAKENVSGCVYVERAVAKVTCDPLKQSALQLKFYDENGEMTLADKGYTLDLKDVTVNYVLANTPKSSYLIRNVEFEQSDNLAEKDHFKWDMFNNKRYRMIGNDPIPALRDPFHKNPENLYRTYWCKDPFYNKAMNDGDKTIVNETTLASTEEGSPKFVPISNTLYCKENTFQVQFQNYQNTTLALFEVKFTIKKGGYTVPELYIRDDNAEKIYIDKQSAYHDGITRIIRDPNVQDAVKNSVAAGKSLPQGFSYRDHLEIEIDSEEDDDSGLTYLEVKNISLKYDKDTEDYFDENSAATFQTKLGAANKKDLLDAVNALVDVTVYPDCKSYYVVPVKHFGDYYTPWDKDDNKGLKTFEVYNDGAPWTSPNATHAQEYLGRYGIVRNNWYALNISKIASLGSSVIPDTNVDTADDNNEDKKFFAVEIHILSWAKRVQDIVF